jgi:uncharacterized protein involved in exopolysaccharide biosynthesis/Mrp family chromosome partitioning ATPase
VYNQPITLAYPTPTETVHEKPLHISQLIRFLFDNWLLIAGFTAFFSLIMLLYVIITPATYVASVQLLFSPQSVQSDTPSRPSLDETLIEGELEIVKSSDVLRGVIREMNLDEDPEFTSGRASVSSGLRSLASAISSGGIPDVKVEKTGFTLDDPTENNIISLLRNQLWVRQVGQSNVMEITASSIDPKKSAQLANAIAEQYIAHDVLMNSQSSQQASEWLEQRVADLRQEVFTADRAVVQFQSSGNPSDQFKLSELKSVADTYRRLYETYLLNWSEAKQKISYPVSDAMFVSRAIVPTSKSQPKRVLLMAFAIVLGLSAGLIVAIIRHFASRVVTSMDRITAETAVPCIGAVSLAGSKPNQNGPVLSLPRVQGLGQENVLWNRGFNRDLRNLKATVTGMRRSRKANLIGVVGVDSKAGATTIAYNLAILASSSGSKTLLIDASAANPTLSRTFTAEQSIGLMEMLDDRQAYIDFMSRVERRLTILPVGAFQDVTPGERIGSERIAFSFADLKDRFDLILVDLPSMPGSADAKAVAPHLDGSIIVVRSGQTPFDALDHVVDALREVNAELLGIVLNATSSRKPGRR